MSRFNTQSPGTKTVNLAGGEAFSQSPELELVSILLTSFAQDQFYRSADDTFVRLKNLITDCDKKFVAKAAIYARNEFGMRSISHVCASELARHASGQPWAKKFYERVAFRPDDITEIISYHLSKNGKLTAAMKKGLAAAFGKFDAYRLAKYRGEGKSVSLVDAVRLVHPEPSEKNKEALAALIKGDLKAMGTWETKLTQAGQQAESDEQKDEFKKEAWKDLITKGTLPYFALLRNLRNIIEQAPEMVPAAMVMLTDEKRIKNSKVLPFRFLTAYHEIMQLHSTGVREMLGALSVACETAVSNVPKFPGATLVVLDTSSSMKTDHLGAKSPHKIGGLFAAALVKANNCDLITFDGDARYVNLNARDTVMTLANSIEFRGGSTNFHAIFQRANKAYDRIIILSDMQGWVGRTNPSSPFSHYKMATNCNPMVYSFDLQNYGSMQFPESRVMAIAGFSEKVFDLMALLEQDKNALINEINKIDL